MPIPKWLRKTGFLRRGSILPGGSLGRSSVESPMSGGIAGGARTPEQVFHSNHYLRHNARRLEHLASLGIPVRGLSVLEVGAGIGDHSHYYIDRGCRTTITESRPENLALLRERYPNAAIRALDMEAPEMRSDEMFDAIHCYGLLYHLSNPIDALAFLSRHCSRIMFLETCVSFGSDFTPNLVEENGSDFSQAVGGIGCRPTRLWLWAALKELFEFVYLPKTQPNHEEFPLDWANPEWFRANSGSLYGLSRCVFVCSRMPLENDLLAAELLDRQFRHP